MGLFNPLLWRLQSRKVSEVFSEQIDYEALILKLFALLNFLILFWLLITSYWIYTAYEPKDDALCKVYLFAVWLVIPMYFVAVILATINYCFWALFCAMFQGIE